MPQSFVILKNCPSFCRAVRRFFCFVFIGFYFQLDMQKILLQLPQTVPRALTVRARRCGFRSRHSMLVAICNAIAGGNLSGIDAAVENEADDIGMMFDTLANAEAPVYGQRAVRHHNTHK